MIYTSAAGMASNRHLLAHPHIGLIHQSVAGRATRLEEILIPSDPPDSSMPIGASTPSSAAAQERWVGGGASRHSHRRRWSIDSPDWPGRVVGSLRNR
jgi:hypothetical protein